MMNGENRYPPVAHGMRLGIKVAFILASAYAVGGILVEIGWQVWLTRSMPTHQLPIIGDLGMLLSGFLMVLALVGMLGTLTGGLIGELWVHLGQRVSGLGFSLVGLAVCAIVVIGIHLLYAIQVDLSIPPTVLNGSPWPGDSIGSLGSYIYMIGLPSVVYILTGVVSSGFFWQMHKCDAA